jgi:hypothetical protein
MQNASAQDKRAVLQRGQERYQIYCQPCHGLAGYGDGMIVKRGMAKPPSYHIARLKEAPDGHFFDVITNGYGSMYSYSNRVPPRDRWAIVAYMRALQRSQDARPSDVPAGVDTNKTQITPEIDRRKYMGPGAGRQYHGTGPGGAGLWDRTAWTKNRARTKREQRPRVNSFRRRNGSSTKPLTRVENYTWHNLPKNLKAWSSTTRASTISWAGD